MVAFLEADHVKYIVYKSTNEFSLARKKRA
jgi:hypothetical protein